MDSTAPAQSSPTHSATLSSTHPSCSSSPLVHYLLVLEYDGTSFHGSSGFQRNHRTVQSVLTSAFQQVTRCPSVHLLFSSRTDADVSATSQVATLTLPAAPTCPAFPAQRLRFLVNAALLTARLHRSLHVSSVARVQPQFHPRFSALGRVYSYRLVSGEPLLFEARHSWHIPAPLDVQAMRRAAALFVGRHDFTSLISRDAAQGQSAIRSIDSIVISCPPPYRPAPDSRVVDVEFTAPAFLRHQVRNVVAVLVEVGRGRMGWEEVGRLLKGVERQWNPLVAAPGCGLLLRRVVYNEELMKQWLIPDEEEGGKQAVGSFTEDRQGEELERDKEEQISAGEASGPRVKPVKWKATDSPPGTDFLWKRDFIPEGKDS